MTYPKKISISHQSVLESLYYVKVNRKNLQICNSGFLSTKLVYRLEFTKEHEEKIAEENTTIDQTITPNIKQHNFVIILGAIIAEKRIQIKFISIRTF